MARISYGNTWAQLEGTLQEEAIVRDYLTFYVEGYQFTRPFKLHKWDGKKRLLTPGGKFPSGLARPVAQAIYKATGEQQEIVDTRERPVPVLEWGPLRIPKNGQMQEHQERAVTRIMQATRGIVYHSVGAGKSIVIIEAVRRTGLTSLVIVPTKDLLHQLHDDFELMIGTKDQHIGIIGDSIWQPNDITVATVQTITRSLAAGKGKQGGIDLEGLAKRRRMVDLLQHFDAIHVDECHHLPSASYGVLMANLPRAYFRIGYSATPLRSGAREQELLVTGLTGPIIHQFLPSDSVRAGRSVEADVYMVETGGDPPDDGVREYKDRWGRKRTKRDYATAVQTGIVGHEERNRKIIRLSEVMGNIGPTMVLTQRLEHGRILAAGLAERGHTEVQ